jgi:hypothetical protein
MINKTAFHREEMDLDQPWARFAFASLFIFFHLALACWYAHGQTGPWPKGSFLYFPPSLTDMLESFLRAKTLDPYFHDIPWMGNPHWAGGIANYFPALYFCYWLCGSMEVCGLVTVALVVVTATYLLKRFGLGALVVLLACFPMIFGLDRGNPDVLIGCSVSASMVLLWDRKPCWAALVLFPAIAFKGYPGLLLLLFVRRGYWQEALACGWLALGVNVGALCWFQGGITHNAEGFVAAIRLFNHVVTARNENLGFSADPYNALRIISLGVNKGGLDPAIAAACDAVTSAYIFGWVFLANAVWSAFRKDISEARRLFAVTMGMLWFPNVCADYKLLCLVPTVLLLCAQKERWCWRDYVVFLCVLYVLVPEQYLFLYSDVSVSCLIDPALLTLSLLVTV